MHILNVVDGCIPSDMATGKAAEIEEERRLLYVGMTRARHHLHLVVPQRFYVTQQASRGDQHLYGSLTRFIPSEVAEVFFERVTPQGDSGAIAQCAVADGSAVVDVASRARDLWD